jgi:AcrR family transcriptional regulator
MVLNSRQIALAALDLVEAHGAEGLTMKSLSAALDRRPSSLYNHIAGRDDLVERMRAIIVEDIDTTSFLEKRWDEALIDWGRSYLAAFAARPRSIRLLATTPITDPSTLQMYDVVITSLIGAGWADGDALAVMRTVEAHVLGSALDVIAPGTLLSADAVPPSLGALRTALDPSQSERSSARAAFELGIHALIDGLRSRVDETAAGPA